MSIELENLEKEQRMKRVFAIMVAVLLLACIVLMVQQGIKSRKLASVTQSDEVDIQSLKTENPSRSILTNCIIKKFKTKFLCHYNWEKYWVNENAMTYQINQNPDVYLKIVRFDADILYIQQLSRDQIEALGQYAQGFAIENTEITDFKAIKVKAFSKDNPQIRLLDYYFIGDQQALYAMMFSVSPKSQWDNYKFIFQRIVDSFRFE